MKEILVSGSIAYDTIIQLSSLFSEQSVPYNFSLLAKKHEKNHGGTGANILYNLALLGENAILLGAYGRDYTFAKVIENQSNLQYIHKEDKLQTAHSTIVADAEDNRLTFFYPGAMAHSSESKIQYIKEDIGVAIVSANHIPTMLEHIRALRSHEKNNIIFADPAQQVSQMTQEELQEFLGQADYLIANQYEYEEILRKLGVKNTELQNQFKAIIVTYGNEGSCIYLSESYIEIPAIHPEYIEDTTGAGDAYRAGILKAFIDGYDLKIGCQLGTLLASYCIQGSGSQYHHVTVGQLIEDMQKHFGVEIDLYTKRKF